MGCLFGAKLSGHADVILVGRWPEQIATLQREPLLFVQTDGSQVPVTLRATNRLDEITPVDIALIVTKASKTEKAARDAVQVLAPNGLAITLQNGIGNLEILAAHVGPDRAALGVTMQGAVLEGPGRLRHGGDGLTALAAHPAIHTFAVLLRQAGMETTVLDDVQGLIWGKLAINAAINPLTALLRVPNGVLLESEPAHHLLRCAANEVADVAAALGITLPFEDAATRAEQVAARTARNRSSMLQDTLRNVETEIEFINGAVVRAGERLGIETPVNRTLYELVKAAEKTYAARVDG
jgi:2-dehydropantoate 2-reductase